MRTDFSAVQVAAVLSVTPGSVRIRGADDGIIDAADTVAILGASTGAVWTLEQSGVLPRAREDSYGGCGYLGADVVRALLARGS